MSARAAAGAPLIVVVDFADAFGLLLLPQLAPISAIAMTRSTAPRRFVAEIHPPNYTGRPGGAQGRLGAGAA